MIKKYVEKLIKNLPKECRKMKTIDLIFDGGAFNGSYLIGAAYFLKRMEEKLYIKIDRISSCSIGSFVSLLYVADRLDVFLNFIKCCQKILKMSIILITILIFVKNLYPFYQVIFVN